MAIDAYELIKRRLTREMLEARAVFDRASEKLERLRLLSQEFETGPEARTLLEWAKRVYDAAHQVYTVTGQRLNDLLRNEIFNEEKRDIPSGCAT